MAGPTARGGDRDRLRGDKKMARFELVYIEHPLDNYGDELGATREEWAEIRARQPHWRARVEARCEADAINELNSALPPNCHVLSARRNDGHSKH